MKIKGLSCRDGIYYYRPPQVGGIRPKRISLKTRDPSKAVLLALEMQQRSAAQIGPERLHGEIQRFLAAREHDYRPRTFETMQSTLRVFERWAGNPQVTDITSAQIERWKASLASLSNSGRVAYLRRVQSFFSWLKNNERIHTHPFDNVKIPKAKGSKAVSYCTREQRDLLIESCDRDDLRFVLMCGFFLGLRRAEIDQAIPRWFSTPGLVEVTETPTYRPKDGERRMIHYGQRFADYLASYDMQEPFALRPDITQGSAAYRYDIRKPFERLCETCGLEWVTPHVMRHTFATLHIQAGTPLPTVADWLGDSYDVTYHHYAAYAPTDSHVRNLD